MVKQLSIKYIIISIILPVCGLGGLTSCLHDNEEVFEKSAAERIADAVATDKAILESAKNGWHMTLWTVSDYGGGGYNMYLKFKDGKVEIKGDIAPASMTIKSSYDVIKDQGPVLTFNTYNDIMHYMANPSASLLDGNGGDYEFVIKSATAEKIVLKGKKSQNIMEMTPLPDTYNVEEAIAKVQANTRNIAGYFLNDNTQIIVDPSTRRFYQSTGKGQFTSRAYAPTTTGIKVAGMDSELSWDAANKQLKYNGKSFISQQPEGYNSIDNWHGTWNLRYINSEKSSYDTFQLTLEPTGDLIQQEALGALTGKFTIEGYTFEMIVYYSPVTGLISIPAQYIDDPTGTYGMFLVLGCDAYSSEGLSWYAVDWNFEYDKESGKYIIKGDNTNAGGNDMNTMMMLAVDSSGNLIGNANGQAISLVTLMFPDYFTKVTNE